MNEKDCKEEKTVRGRTGVITLNDGLGRKEGIRTT